MPLLALDLSKNTGWACYDSAGLLISGTLNLSPSTRWESYGTYALRLTSWLRFQVDNLNDGADPVIAFEQPIPRRGQKGQTPVPVLLAGSLVQECERMGLTYFSPTPSTLKKLATGKGNAPKHAVIEAARAKWPEQNVESDDQADALWCLEWLRLEVGE
jgi:Holliday junction resolvasome, endonuclease subunit